MYAVWLFDIHKIAKILKDYTPVFKFTKIRLISKEEVDDQIFRVFHFPASPNLDPPDPGLPRAVRALAADGIFFP